MTMILWTRAKLEDFIRLIDFRRAFLNFFLAIIMGARYILRGRRRDKAWRILWFGSKMAEMSFLTHTRWPSGRSKPPGHIPFGVSNIL
jgi:hypothetical protein